MKKGILTVVSGFSGAGKGTIIKELRKNMTMNCRFPPQPASPAKAMLMVSIIFSKQGKNLNR